MLASKRSRIALVLLLLFLLGAYWAYGVYGIVFGPSIKLDKTIYVHIAKGSDAAVVGRQLRDLGVLSKEEDFIWLADYMQYRGRAGRYELKPQIKTLRQLIQVLRSEPSPVKLTFNNLRKKEQLPPMVGRALQADSLELQELLSDSLFLAEWGFTPRNVMAMFIPNTYEFYWETDARAFLERMKKEYDKFWNEERLAKAKLQGLTAIEVAILASIVETETRYEPEKARIAGVYLNRLRKGWKLEADPTVVFAHGDFELRRVLRRHLELDSPYNTYRYEGLPPGPIYMASVKSLEAVLNPETHEYMFFCARPDQSGAHAFAKTLAAHNQNAKAYHQWLNSLKK